jgi:hypothetical protein
MRRTRGGGIQRDRKNVLEAKGRKFQKGGRFYVPRRRRKKGKGREKERRRRKRGNPERQKECSGNQENEFQKGGSSYAPSC